MNVGMEIPANKKSIVNWLLKRDFILSKSRQLDMHGNVILYLGFDMYINGRKQLL